MGSAEPGHVVAARYRLRTVIREDYKGAVWLAHDGLRHGDVALRAIPWAPPSYDGEQESRRMRLLSEARALAELDHPNIVRVLNVAEEAGQPWMVVQATPYRFPYRPLSEAVRSDGTLWPEQAAEVGLQVLAALRHAHSVGVLHRDIRPGSILLGPGGQVLLADFGMVTADGSPALTTLEELNGSPLYMAPERASGGPATPEADMWSLGAALYAAVEGRAPFYRDSTVAIVSAVINASPDRPRRAGPLWPVISGLLRKDPGARPDADAVEWLFERVAGWSGPPPLAPRAGYLPDAAGAAPAAASAAAPPALVAASQPHAPAVDGRSAVDAAEAGSAPPAEGAAPGVAAEETGSAEDAGPAVDAEDTESAADFVPGFRPRDHQPAAAEPHGRKPWRQRRTTTGKAR